MRVLEAIRLLKEGEALGVHLEAHAEELRYAPDALVTPELLARLHEHKDTILAILRGRERGNGHACWPPYLGPICPICPSREFWLPRRENKWMCSVCSSPASPADVVARIRRESDDLILTFENLVDKPATR